MSRHCRVIAVILVTGILAILGCKRVHQGPFQLDSGYRVVMGTMSRLVVIAPDRSTAQRSLEAVFTEQLRLEALMSYHRTDSELARINAEAFPGPLHISDPLFEVLSKAMEVSRLSDGAFDMTVGPLMDLWKHAAEANAVPTDADVESVRAKTGWTKVRLGVQDMTVRFEVPGMRIDLGGIAKGYAVDKSIEVMKKTGALGGMVDLGGNIRCFGQAPKGKTAWRIGVQDPFNTDDSAGEGQVLLVLQLTDQSVATSGHYRRSAQVQGRKVSHILDPKTGHGSDRLASVTIIAPDATTADGLSTAVIVSGKAAGLALVECLPDVEAILVPNPSDVDTASPPSTATLIKSSGANRYILPVAAKPRPSQ